MPEGDTVFRACAQLHRALAGRALVRAEFRVPRYATTDLTGVTVVEVVPRGKHQLTRFDNGLTLHTHLRMDGTWRVVEHPAGQAATEPPATERPGDGRSRGPLQTPNRAGRRSARGRYVAPPGRWQPHEIRVLLGNQEATAYGLRLPVVELLPTADEHRVVGHLGPDLLAADFDPDEAVRRLRAAPGRSIGEALLDQRNLAGIGTFYRAELCFLQGIHPRTPVAEVRDPERLVRRARQLLQANSTRPFQITTGNPRERAWVFERTRQPCRRCGTPIRCEEFGPPGQERLSYWCPTCQPLQSAG